LPVPAFCIGAAKRQIAAEDCDLQCSAGCDGGKRWQMAVHWVAARPHEAPSRL